MIACAGERGSRTGNTRVLEFLTTTRKSVAHYAFWLCRPQPKDCNCCEALSIRDLECRVYRWRSESCSHDHCISCEAVQASCEDLCRRNEEIDSLERTAPSGGVWGSLQQPPWWQVLPLAMVGSVSDPDIIDLIAKVNDSGLWADSEVGPQATPRSQPTTNRSNATTTYEAATAMLQLNADIAQAGPDHPSPSTSSSGFQFIGLAKPPSLHL